MAIAPNLSSRPTTQAKYRKSIIDLEGIQKQLTWELLLYSFGSKAVSLVAGSQRSLTPTVEAG